MGEQQSNNYNNKEGDPQRKYSQVWGFVEKARRFSSEKIVRPFDFLRS